MRAFIKKASRINFYFMLSHHMKKRGRVLSSRLRMNMPYNGRLFGFVLPAMFDSHSLRCDKFIISADGGKHIQ